MLLSELALVHGVFDWLASSAVRTAAGSSARLFALVYGIGIVTTVFLSNDATAVVLTPAVLAAVRKAKVAPLPYLFACAMIANAASFVLPISNPANLVVFRQSMPSLGHWLLAFAAPSLASIVATFAVLRFLFRNCLRASITTQVAAAPLTRAGKLVLAGLAFVVAVLLAASAFNRDLGLPTSLAALAITAIVSASVRTNPLPLLKNIGWSTLALVGGLFILVDAVESQGALNLTKSALHWTQALPGAPASLLTGSVVALAGNLVNNLPLGLIAGATLHATHLNGLLSNSVLIAVDLGPNLSVTGSLATILWLIALRQQKLDVRAWDFLKIGAAAMPVALLAALTTSILMRALRLAT
jgi:arsenical pump membrane protein